MENAAAVLRNGFCHKIGVIAAVVIYHDKALILHRFHNPLDIGCGKIDVVKIMAQCYYEVVNGKKIRNLERRERRESNDDLD